MIALEVGGLVEVRSGSGIYVKPHKEVSQHAPLKDNNLNPAEILEARLRSNATPLTLHPQRLFPSDPGSREIARRIYLEIKQLPIISPHGHTDPGWFARNQPFANATELIVTPDHYVLRMLYSQGIALEDLGIPGRHSDRPVASPRSAWRQFARHYHYFRGTPSRLWLDHVFQHLFGMAEVLNSSNADNYFDHINDQLQCPAFLPRALFQKFNIEVLATTESPLDSLQHHKTIQQSDWPGRVITTFRPDPVVDPEYEGFSDNIVALGKITGEDTSHYSGYLAALRARRAYFIQHGATASDHGHPTPATADLSQANAGALYAKVINGKATAAEAELFRAQMLTEMAAMSLEDGLVMQIHPGSHRNHNADLFREFGRDKGADIPVATHYADQLKPLLTKFGNRSELSIILFTLDETNYSRELAPLAGHYPCLKLGPPWWFHDSPEGMRRYRQQVTETAGFYNTVGFNDDTRAFLSIPARHDVARRMDCTFLAELVADHRMPEAEAVEVAIDLSYRLPKQAYKL
ncbi:MAG: glucuronate isomerase [Halieaceae bacterium]|nr:glucuronate isomerase [Halieaceae bacterium]